MKQNKKVFKKKSFDLKVKLLLDLSLNINTE